MEKKRVIIVGAGQMGKAAAQLLNPNTTELLGFADNDSSKWNDRKPPVFSIETAINLNPDEIIISVLGDDRARSLAEQLKVCRFYGNITLLKDIYADFDIRSRCIRLAAERIKTLGISGELAELGVYRGDTAWQMNALMPDRKIYLFDTFQGFDERDINAENIQGASKACTGDFSDTAAEKVLQRLQTPDNAILRKGYFPDTAAGLDDLRFALVSLDPDLYAPTLAGLEYFYPRLNSGGMIVVHDYNNLQFRGVKMAVAEYEAKLLERGGAPLKIVPLADLHGSCIIIK